MKIFDHKVLDELSRQAAESPRRRKNLNLHDNYQEPCQRLFNAVEPGSYVRPHRHSDPHKPECIMVVRGRMALELPAPAPVSSFSNHTGASS